jgi:hypothetical protein
MKQGNRKVAHLYILDYAWIKYELLTHTVLFTVYLMTSAADYTESNNRMINK